MSAAHTRFAREWGLRVIFMISTFVLCSYVVNTFLLG